MNSAAKIENNKSPSVGFAADMWESSLNASAYDGSMVKPTHEDSGGTASIVKMKELWSAEELTVNLGNKTAMRIANLKSRLNEQLKTIKLLQENRGKFKDSSEHNHEEKKIRNSYISEENCHFGKRVAVSKVKKPGQSFHSKKAKQSCITRLMPPQTKRKKRRRRGVPLKDFFYHPLVVECRASGPEQLTKEEFLRQLRLIPISYFQTQSSQKSSPTIEERICVNCGKKAIK